MNIIKSIKNSRNILLDVLQNEYKVDEIPEYSIDEIDKLNQNMDFLDFQLLIILII